MMEKPVIRARRASFIIPLTSWNDCYKTKELSVEQCYISNYKILGSCLTLEQLEVRLAVQYLEHC
jgi:hypothetical protein